MDSDCSNFRLPSRSGSSGSVSFTDLAPGRYVLRVAAANSKEDRVIERRRFEISSDPSFCTTHLINRGVTVTGDTATVDFTGTGPAETFRCRLDTEPAFACKFSNLHYMHLQSPCANIPVSGSNPVELTGLGTGQHSLKIVPQDCGKNRRQQTVKFTV